jgi:hypothetical protein
MKKIVFTGMFVFLSSIVIAQKNEPVIKKDTLNKKNAFALNSRLLTFSQLDQRKIYHWDNGQASTPTGRQAGEITPKYVRVYGDSAAVVWHPFKKTALPLNKSPW